MIRFMLNNDIVSSSRPAGSLLLDVLREDLRLTGTKEGCREGDCGACTVLLGRPEGTLVRYQAVNACLLPLGDVAARHVVTIEGLRTSGLTPVQAALVEEGAIQCGFCTPGIVMALTALLLDPPPSDAGGEAAAAAGNLCRCTGYTAIRRAVARIARSSADVSARRDEGDRVRTLIARGYLPGWFETVPARLHTLARPPAPPSGVFVGGGTDLFVRHPEGLENQELRFLSGHAGLNYIRESDGWCRIGGATTIADLEESAVMQRHFPSLHRDLALIASRQIRSRATVAGNFINASPAADLSAWFLPLRTELELRGDAGTRCVPLEGFFRGYKEIDLNPGEVLAEIRFRSPGPGSLFRFEKVSRRPHLDIASVNSAIALCAADGVLRDVRLSAGGVAPVPRLLGEAMARLEGRELSSASILDAATAAAGEVAPISDVRGSAEYKRELTRRIVLAHFLALFPSLPGAEFLR